LHPRGETKKNCREGILNEFFAGGKTKMVYFAGGKNQFTLLNFCI
jgi:hypothetical protein